MVGKDFYTLHLTRATKYRVVFTQVQIRNYSKTFSSFDQEGPASSMVQFVILQSEKNQIMTDIKGHKLKDTAMKQLTNFTEKTSRLHSSTLDRQANKQRKTTPDVRSASPTTGIRMTR